MRTFACLAGLLLSQSNTLAQTEHNQVAKATEFTIPVSPAFDLLAVTPGQIARPNNIREFKVDWSFRSWRLKPNIAIQAQPVWEIAYNRADLSKYRKAPRWLQTLSTLDVSAGTIEDADQRRRASIALKINLFRQHDPLLETYLFEGVDTVYRQKQQLLEQEIAALKTKKREKNSSEEKLKTLLALDSLQQLYDAEKRVQKIRIKELSDNYVRKHWNAAHVDLAWGRLFSYENAALDSISLRGQASAIWLNGSHPLGKKILLTGTLKHLRQEAIDSTFVGGKVNSGGVGLRYGSPRFTFFSEVVFSKFKNEARDNGEKTLNLAQLEQISTTYGGDWRINHNILLSYGVRLDYSTNFKLKNIVPIAGISCMMR